MADLVSMPEPGGRESGRLEDGIGLCLSGGGYRAMLFHVGALWRLNEVGLLQRLKRISSVSGGSITAAKLGLEWKKLEFQDGVASNLGEKVFAPIRRLASVTVDVPAVILGFVWPGLAASWVRRCYDCKLFRGAKLDVLPADGEGPRFVINATNLQSGALWRFSRPYMGDYVIGRIPNPTIPLSLAVAASSAFPPLLSPVILGCRPEQFTLPGVMTAGAEEFQNRILLADGGVYDNLGLETAWKQFQTILVSDGGQKMKREATLWTRWIPQAKRVFEIVDDQVRNLRKRQVISAFQNGDRKGAYWGIRTDIRKYELSDVLPTHRNVVENLAATPTRLKRIEKSHQEQLINWGYAVCDAALRKHVNSLLPPPKHFPYPNAGLS